MSRKKSNFRLDNVDEYPYFIFVSFLIINMVSLYIVFYTFFLNKYNEKYIEINILALNMYLIIETKCIYDSLLIIIC